MSGSFVLHLCRKGSPRQGFTCCPPYRVCYSSLCQEVLVVLIFPGGSRIFHRKCAVALGGELKEVGREHAPVVLELLAMELSQTPSGPNIHIDSSLQRFSEPFGVSAPFSECAWELFTIIASSLENPTPVCLSSSADCQQWFQYPAVSLSRSPVMGACAHVWCGTQP